MAVTVFRIIFINFLFATKLAAGEREGDDNYTSGDVGEIAELIASGVLWSPSVFSDVYLNSPASSNLEEYVPITSRGIYRGEYKIWPKTFDTFLLRMKLPVLKLVKFILHTITSPIIGVELNPWDINTVKQSSWNPMAKTKILIHGYQQSSQTVKMPLQLKNKYFYMNTTSNIVLLEWETLAAQNYFESAMYAQKVGRFLGEFLLVLKNRGFILTFSSVHLVGFCLGAHVAGAAAQHLKNRVGKFTTLGRITGLDPAGPGFYKVRKELRLDLQDADFVDVIHTNGGLNYGSSELGIPDTVGHADFFPNGGLSQPICSETIPPSNMIYLCNHLKAPDYFRRSIGGEVFRACKCESWSAFDTEYCSCASGPYMGEYVQKTIGKYYLHVFEYTLQEMFELEGLMDKIEI